MYCTRCGNQTGELDKFCSQCGHLAPGPAGSAPSTAFTAPVQQQSAQMAVGAMPQLTRSLRNRKIAGVCAGIARHFGVDATLVRILFVVMFFCPVLPAIIPYIVCWIVMPLERPEPLYYPSNVSYPMSNQPFSPAAR